MSINQVRHVVYFTLVLCYDSPRLSATFKTSLWVEKKLMSVLRRLLPYIILNIIVSAAATFAVLTWWNNGRPLPPGWGSSPVPTQAAATSSLPVSTALPADARVVEITEVVGAGNLDAESITIQRIGEGELRMNGWRLEDSLGHRFIFPDIILFKDGIVRVFTRAGTNTVNELHWGLTQAVWSSGKTISLVDDQGILRATLAVP
jgi:hypothetical protein